MSILHRPRRHMPTRLTLPGGRALTYDEVGDPDGLPVVYLHGTPDSRLARHPDDELAAAAGIRLLAVDRPGYGGTSALPPGSAAIVDAASAKPTAASASARVPAGTTQDDAAKAVESRSAQSGAARSGFAGDLVTLLDDLGIERAGLLAWSGGALDGVAVAADARLAERLLGVHLVAGLVPREGYDDPDVREAGKHRLGLLDLADDLPPAELAEAVAPMLAPWPCDHALALEHQRDQRDPADQTALEGIPGAVERLADALVEAVRHGLAGVQADLATQVRPYAVDLSTVTVPVQLWYGTTDTVTPPAFGHWFDRQLPHAELHLVEAAGHYLPFTHWPTLLSALAALS